MKKYLWSATAVVLLLVVGVTTATILDGEHSSFSNSIEVDHTTTSSTSTSTPKIGTGEEISPAPEKPAVPSPKPPVITPPPSTTTKCYIGGCSGQLCSSEPGMASTCEYRPEYACYKKTTCEVQASGECGWTATTEFNACLANPEEEL